MISVTAAFKAAMYYSPLLCSATLRLANGTEIPLPFNKFTPNSEIVSSSGDSGFPLGAAISRTATLEIVNRDLSFSSVDLYGASIDLFGTLDIGGGQTETIELGTFNVIDAKQNLRTLAVSCADDMTKTDVKYLPTISGKVSLFQIAADAAAQVGITPDTNFGITDEDLIEWGEFEIWNLPADGYTCRQILGFCACSFAANAIIGMDNKLRFHVWDFPTETLPYNPVLDAWSQLEIGQDQITITGINLNGTREIGTTEYMLKVVNPMAESVSSFFLRRLADILLGKSFWRFSGEHKGYPIAEFMDGCEIVKNGTSYFSVITDYVYKFFGFTTFGNLSENGDVVDSSYESPANNVAIELNKRIDELYADSAFVDNLFSQNITVNGELKSSDFAALAGTPYAQTGMELDFANKTIKAEQFAVDADGNLYAKGGEIAGLQIQRKKTYYGYGGGMWKCEYCEDSGGNPVTFTSYQNGSSFSIDADGTMVFYRQGASLPSLNFALAYLEFYGYAESSEREEFTATIEFSNDSATLKTIHLNVPFSFDGSSGKYTYLVNEQDVRGALYLRISADLLANERIGVIGSYWEYKWALEYGTEEIGGRAGSVYIGNDGISVGDKIKLLQNGVGYFDSVNIGNVDLTSALLSTFVTAQKVTVLNNNSATVNVNGNTTRGVLFISSRNTNGRGVYLWAFNNDGTFSSTPVLAASDITLSGTNGVITIANSGGFYAYAMCISI